MHVTLLMYVKNILFPQLVYVVFSLSGSLVTIVFTETIK